MKATLAVLFLLPIATLAFPAKDSQDFANAYYGNQIWDGSFQNSWSELNGAGAIKSLNATTLNYDHTSSTVATTLDGTATGWAVGCANDWTCEFKLRFKAIPEGFALWLGTGSARAVIEIFPDRTADLGGNSFNVAHNNTDGNFHRFRVAHDSANGRYYLWRDNLLLTPAGVAYDAVATDNRLLLGDYTKNLFGDNFDVEIAWVRFDPTGFFAPPGEPDPSALYAWYRSDDGLTVNGSTVSRWENQATSAGAYLRHLDRVVGTPEQIDLITSTGSGSAVRLNGFEALWSAAGAFGTLDSAKTLLIALKLRDASDGFLFDGTTNTGMTRSQIRNRQWQVGIQPPPIGNASNPDPVSADATTNTWQVHAYTFKEIGAGTEIQHHINGTLQNGATNENTNPLSGLILGMNAAASMGLNVDIAEVLVYSNALSAEERQIASGYLENRWLDASEPALDLVSAPYRQTLLTQGDNGVHTYRIPGLVTATNGTLIAVFDIRHDSSADLPANIDVGMRRSFDNGITWEPARTIMDMGSDPAWSYDGVGDPCILVDSVTGRIWVGALWSHGNNGWAGSGPGLLPEETGQFVLVYSDDNGESWSDPVNITSQVKDPSWRLCFQGPGGGFTARDGTLIMPAQYKDGAGVPRSCFIASTDRGATWKISAPAVPSGIPLTTESQMAELNSGAYLISMRNHAGLGKRAWATTADGGTNWSAVTYANPDPVCQASLIRYSSTLDGAEEDILLFANPANSSSRVNMTIRMSHDEGTTWTTSRLLDSRLCGYSCMTVLQDGTIGILYEAGESSSIQSLVFARFTIEWLTRGSGTHLQYGFDYTGGLVANYDGGIISDDSGSDYPGIVLFHEPSYSPDTPPAALTRFCTGSGSLDLRNGHHAVRSRDTSIITAEDLEKSGGVTLEAWVRHSSTGDYGTILSLADSVSIVSQSAGTDSYRVVLDSVETPAPSFPITDAQKTAAGWTHLAAVIRNYTAVPSGTVELWINGRLAESVPISSAPLLSPAIAVGLGSRTSSTSGIWRWDGLIYEPRITARALNPDEFTFRRVGTTLLVK